MIKLADWSDISNIPDAERDPLQRFIYNNEPAGKDEEAFRKDLQAAVNYLLEGGWDKGKKKVKAG